MCVRIGGVEIKRSPFSCERNKSRMDEEIAKKEEPMTMEKWIFQEKRGGMGLKGDKGRGERKEDPMSTTSRSVLIQGQGEG